MKMRISRADGAAFKGSALGLEINAPAGENLARALWLSGCLPVRPLCAGLGRCGRCRVRYVNDAPVALPAEEAVFSAQELASGFRLACRRQVPDGARSAVGLAVNTPEHVPEHVLEYAASAVAVSAVLYLELPADAFEVVELFGALPKAPAPDALAGPKDVALGVDVGTTSVYWRAVFLHGEARGRTAREGRFLNPQAGAGADIMSRLAFARTDAEHKLSQLVRQALANVMAELRGVGLRVGSACLAANTAMTDILLERDISGLCAAPYQMFGSGHELVNFFAHADARGKMLAEGQVEAHVEGHVEAQAEAHVEGQAEGHVEAQVLAQAELRSLPAFYIPPLPAPFVGGDISSGLAALMARGTPRPFVLADLGTNGELALLAENDELFLTSVPLGPALEGIGPECGQQAGPHVVTEFRLSPTGLSALTPGEMLPAYAGRERVRGISATGYLSLLALLRSLGLIRPCGRFATPEELSGLMPLARRLAAGFEFRLGGQRLQLPHALWLAAHDVEELLKVKAAFALALDSLLAAAGLRPADVAVLCLAGSLGEHVRPADLEALGFVPAGLSARLQAVGNTSLEGAALLALEPERRDALARLCASARVLVLTEDPDFQHEYLRRMRFGE